MENQIATESYNHALAIVVALEERLEVAPRDRSRPLAYGQHSVEALEAMTQRLEFLAIDLALEIEAQGDTDLLLSARHRSARAQLEDKRRAEPQKYFLLDLAAKAEREEARKAAMAAWQKLRSLQKEDRVPAERRTRLPAHFEQLPTLGYQSLAERYTKLAEPIEEELEYWRRKTRENLEKEFRNVLHLGNELAPRHGKKPRQPTDLSQLSNGEINERISEMRVAIHLMSGRYVLAS